MADAISPPLSILSIVVCLWLAGCPAKSTLISWRIYYGGGGMEVDTCAELSKHEDLTQCCFNIGSPPTALDQHWNNIGSGPRVCWENCLHFETLVPSVSGWNKYTVLCVSVYPLLWFGPVWCVPWTWPPGAASNHLHMYVWDHRCRWCGGLCNIVFSSGSYPAWTSWYWSACYTCSYRCIWISRPGSQMCLVHRGGLESSVCCCCSCCYSSPLCIGGLRGRSC